MTIDGHTRHGRARDDVSGAVDSDLRSDVRYLGNLLGRVLRETGGEDLLHDVESLRAAVIDAFEGGEAEGAARAEAIVAAMSAERAEAVAQAFTTYFHLTNLAEEHHRVRVLRFRGDDGGVAGDSFPATYASLVEQVGEDEAAARLRELRFHPVLTAHPTEARRRAVTTAVRRITDLIDERDRTTNTTARAENERRLLEEITTLLRTSPLRTTRPTPLDEVRTAMSVFDQTLFEIVPQVYRLLDDRLLGDDAGRASVTAPAFVRFGTWIGGDRDGNPHVTADVTRQAAEIAAEHILLGLSRAATRIGSTLTLDASETPADAGLTALVATQEALDAGIAERIGVRAPNETHRRALMFVAARIDATRTGATSTGTASAGTASADAASADTARDGRSALAYGNPEELLTDLRTIQTSLVAAGATRPANGELQNLIWQVETFGFHLAELEVRQHSQVHRNALAEIRAGGARSEMTEEVLSVFRTIAALQARYGVRSASRYIVSFTQSAADLANVHELAVAALGSVEAAPVLDVIPLFETFADLHASVDILDEAVRTEPFQRRLAATGRRLEVMLGYSDSSKDVGPVSANLALYDAQARIADWAKAHDVELTLFHGRGGSLGRGGGPANEAVLAQPRGSIDGRLKLTEQGEVIFAQYGDKDIAARHLEQMASATLFASSPSNEERTAVAAARFADLAQQLDDESRQAFYDLVKADGFAPWFARVTPMEEIGLLPLGSRPARRGLSVESLEDLRAIPWVFSWTQARINLAGWYGLGSALEAVGDVELLRTAYAEWPLFGAMIKNVEMSLAKTDEHIARRYLELADRDDLAAKVLDEMLRTRDWVLRVSGGSDVLEDRPVLARAVRLRSPYVDALSHLQLRALRAIRTSGSTDPADGDHRLLLLTVNGIAAGLQNTG
ncbi:phosphoenolpyruvate carboxylase [Curtobacterium sp. MCPF17_002]|uniref:phosphoenolpyruvate carboxylase n=1 Tax=Curtobacterium sp. MCPF17_002 TaxID=2175645 RepID=UPI000DA7FE35|nr:phosphoenolpyruvate carboxylase [Curtobacterium sp. MCPF17_002]WIB79070.1 phosphoenolpyruvate carboxylase [Curtobacterium sp. MCPF17_002]